MGRRITKAAEAAAADAVAGHTNDEQVVGSLLKDHLDRHPGVGAAEHRGEGLLRRRAAGLRAVTQLARIERDDPDRPAPARLEKLRERAVAMNQPVPGLDRRPRHLPG